MRERVHAGAGALWSLGWGVLAARGLAAWLRVRLAEPGTRTAVPAPAAVAALEPHAVALVQVLADIALTHLARSPA
jgi:hypothetical protein